MEWYVLTTVAQRELSIAERIRGRDVSVFVPVEYRWRKTRTQARKAKRPYPMFSRYVFVLTDRSGLRDVLETDGVTGVLGSQGRPRPVNAEAMELLFQLSRTPSRLTEPDPFGALGPGVRAVIANGPLAGRDALIKRRSGERVRVALDFLGTERLVEIPAQCLRVAE